MIFDETRLVVKRIEMARRPAHEKLDDTLGLRRMVDDSLGGRARPWLGRLEGPIVLEQTREGNSSEATSGLPEKLAAIDGL